MDGFDWSNLMYIAPASLVLRTIQEVTKL